MNSISRYLLSFCIIGVGAALAVFIVMNGALAQTISYVQYPISELNNCADEDSCRSYCDDPGHITECLAFAERHGLMSGEEIATAKKFSALEVKGPAGCVTKDACEAYCDDISHINECVASAEENGILPAKDLQEIKKVQAAIQRGVQPPPCKGKRECDAYCGEPTHMKVCIAFAEAAGFMEDRELEDAKKMLSALERGVQPLPCNGKQECDSYCSDPGNMEACMTFAEAAGFMNEQEKAESQKMLSAIKRGIKPPQCRGEKECDAYCSEDNHIEECIAFAEAAGFMEPQEAEMARKTGGKRPGKCTNKDECEEFCDSSENQETCFTFGKENGLIPEEELLRMENGKQQLGQSLNRIPPEASQCLVDSLGSEKVEMFKNGTVMPSPEIGNVMRECFEKNTIDSFPGNMDQNMAPGTGFQQNEIRFEGEGQNEFRAGPGGCDSPEACRLFCDSNPEACSIKQPFMQQSPSGPVPDGMMPQTIETMDGRKEMEFQNGPPSVFYESDNKMSEGQMLNPGILQMPMQLDILQSGEEQQSGINPSFPQFQPLDGEQSGGEIQFPLQIQIQQQPPTSDFLSPPPSQESLPSSMTSPRIFMGLLLDALNPVLQF